MYKTSVVLIMIIKVVSQVSFPQLMIASLIFGLAEHPWLQNAKKAPNVPLGDVVKSRLKQFSMMNRFKRRALRVCSSTL